MSSLFNLYTIYWREPLWLLLILLPVAFHLLKIIIRQNNLSSYADKKLLPWVVFPPRSLIIRLFSKNTAYILAWVLFAIALSGPRIPLKQSSQEEIYGANIMLVVDLSRSMRATDIIPNRLRKAKIEIHEFLEKAAGHRIGVTVFSARPHVFIPLTSDYAVLKNYLKILDDLTFPTSGSDPIAAILLAKKELQGLTGQSAIILITDGDYPPLNENNYAQLDELKIAQIPLYILGVATVEGEAVQLKDGTWLKNDNQAVISKMNEETLKNLAARYNGKYSPVFDDDTDWNNLYDNGISQYNSISNITNKQQILWNELFIYFLLPSIFLFLIALSPFSFNLLKNISAFSMITLFLSAFPNNNAMALEWGQSAEQSAYRAYKKGDYALAKKLYQDISGYKSYFGQGNSLYKMGHYQEAKSQFILAILNARTDLQRANTLYNLANSYFRTGDFSSAITTYNDVLRYQPENKAVRYNINVSKTLKKNIEDRLKEKEEILAFARQSQGPRSANVAEGTDISDNTSVSTGGSNNVLNEKIPLPDLPDTNEDTIKKLILSGLENIKIAGDNRQYTARSEFNGNTVKLVNTEQKLKALEDSQHLLWKRLFEMEEGFPAPVETPRTLPGIKPW